MKASIETEVSKVEEALKGTDEAAIKTAMDDLNKLVNEMATNLYSQAEADGAAPNANANADAEADSSESDVEDADFEVVDDEKK